MHGNYLKGSIRNAGLDPDRLPESDPSKMNFGGDAQEGLEGHLGLRPGHRRGQGGRAGAPSWSRACAREYDGGALRTLRGLSNASAMRLARM